MHVNRQGSLPSSKPVTNHSCPPPQIAAHLLGESVLTQFGDQPTAISMTFLLFIVASLIPVFNNSKGEVVGPFTPSAEMLNGRAAMIGFAALLVTEAVNQGAALF